MRRVVAFLCLFSMLVSPATLARGQSELGKIVKARHDLKSVTCYACHTHKRDVTEADLTAFSQNSKAFRNAFGKELDKHLKGKELTPRLEKAKELSSDDPQRDKIIESVTKDFLESLEKVEATKSPAGPTYGELLKSGRLDGVKPKG